MYRRAVVGLAVIVHCFLSTLSCPAQNSAAGIIVTVAGNGIAAFSGDGGVATDSSLSGPTGVTVDMAGNLYIADTDNSRIRQVSPEGIITTVAGNGNFGFSGDGSAATSVSLNRPRDVALDAAGNLYITDVVSNRVRRVSPEGIITTVAGNDEFGISDDGGLATSTALAFPISVTLDVDGSFYFVDSLSFRVRRVSPQGIITTVAGNGNFGFSGDGGPATNAVLDTPQSLAVDAAGNLYVASTQNHRVRKVAFGPATPAVGGTVNGASFSQQPLTAGSIGSTFGTGLSSSILLADSLPLPTSLGGVSLQVNGVAAPLFFVSPGQINFMLPWEVLGLTEAPLTVTSGSVESGSQTLSLAPFNPGIFAINSTGTGQGAVLVAATGVLAAPSGSVSGRAAQPVDPGEFISIFCTGLGAVTNPPATGVAAAADPLSATIAAVSVTIGGIPATVSFSGLTPGFVGLYQVNVRVPDDAPTGDAVEVVLTIGGINSNAVTIAVSSLLPKTNLGASLTVAGKVGV